jgi:hypothetical protein
MSGERGMPLDSKRQSEIDPVDSLCDVAKAWNMSIDSLRRAAARGELKITKLGARRVGLRRSEQQRYLDARTG